MPLLGAKPAPKRAPKASPTEAEKNTPKLLKPSKHNPDDDKRWKLPFTMLPDEHKILRDERGYSAWRVERFLHDCLRKELGLPPLGVEQHDQLPC